MKTINPPPARPPELAAKVGPPKDEDMASGSEASFESGGQSKNAADRPSAAAAGAESLRPSGPTVKKGRKLKILKLAAPYLVSFGLWALLMLLANFFVGSALAPGPAAILKVLGRLAASGDLFVQMGHTVFRGLVGCLLANLLGSTLGLLVGRATWAMNMTAPLVASLQSCPPVIWVTLVMVWAGTGSVVPIATVFAATLPFVFSNTAQGAMGLNGRLLAMGRLYDVPKTRVFRSYVLPAISPFWLAGLSAVLATGWKAAAVAEFLGSHTGVGAKIYWSYTQLNMEELNAWALALIILGLTLEGAVISPLRRKAAKLAVKGAA
ncbi:MAG: ABC transporter permease subunit [Deltaproteobacteria bacterium]|nr:ABC transporter permease subunit [Deltaproteobacteria bacterium]